MNSIGQKFKKSKTIGLKNYVTQTIGNKHSMKNEKVPVLENTPNGLIDNYSNHPNNLYEPIKGIELPKTKHSFQIKKTKHKSKHSNNSNFQ